MAYKIVLKKRFKNKLVKVLDYLEKEWGNKVAVAFLSNLNDRLDMLAEYPEIGKISPKVSSVRAIVISKHNNLYYKFYNNQIIILNMFDTRRKPSKNMYE